MTSPIDLNLVDGMECLVDAIDELLRALRRANDALSNTDFGNHTEIINKVVVQSRTIRETIDNYRRQIGEL